ncbi:MAG: hypothetical protein M3336_13125 [Chloroflexota bacterium]|nr:hypothetical protein [Chloroflexota bacterium]
MSTADGDELARTRPLDPPPSSEAPTSPAVEPSAAPTLPGDGEVPPVERTVELGPRLGREDVVYVPLAITIGDGFKFGCGFFLAAVLAMLVGFVLLAALFLLTSLFGFNLPITR